MTIRTARHLIAGRWLEGTSSTRITAPGTGEVVGELAGGDADLAVRAVDAAAAAGEEWAARSPRYRADILAGAAALLRERSADIARVLAEEAGKRLPEAEGEVAFSAEYLRWFAEEARRTSGTVHPAEAPGRRHLSFRRPAGVALSLTPWNFPVSIQARKLAPALAAGCTVVARVSEKAPLAATALIAALVDAGVPAGVLNLVHGSGRALTPALMGHPAVRVVSFTGSTGVGSSIMQEASRRIVRPLLELGGNAPFIVFDDADLDLAVEGAVIAKLRNTGQSCVGANRFLVQEGVIEEFTSRLAAAFDAMTIGSGLPDAQGVVSDVGPVIDRTRVEEVARLVDEAVAGGAEIVTAARELPSEGSFFAPTLVAGARPTDRIVTEEVFGPAAAIVPFRDDEEALRLGNATDYGLAGYLWTRDARRVFDFGDRLDVGILGVNDPVPSVAFAPMGGTKLSGLGREGSSLGMEEFEEVRYLAWRP